MTNRTQEDYYLESKRIRNEVLQLAEQLKGHPLRFIITNGITMRVEITKNDLKTIVSKNVGDNKFNAIKNALAKDIPGYNSALTSRLPIRTGLLPYIVVLSAANIRTIPETCKSF